MYQFMSKQLRSPCAFVTIPAMHHMECESFRPKVVSIEGRFDRYKSLRSKTRVTSIEGCSYCSSILNLLFIKSV